MAAAGIEDGPLLRSISKGGKQALEHRAPSSSRQISSPSDAWDRRMLP